MIPAIWRTAAMAFLLVWSMPLLPAEIGISNNSALVFGSFAAGSGGTVTVNTSGTCSAGGSVIIVVADCAAAGFTVTGDPNFSYSIDLPADNFVTLSGPGSDMKVTSFSSDPTAANGLLSAGGSQYVSVGGTLVIGNGQAPGSYSGSFSVIVNYN
ncbi:DUF4402 domain-containing protein [Kineobactrum salinum]|uniref:DUF4402 domain-containing protein n=1 Tax=Kineobactrum salinum TaxID=2708301 RepID=A0A6C0U911_9GAMM|nr:DUF4402 domain-containing protein [Kineobactrum salinum]QIB67075.1 DUF4402 domain-containing protein [Kineobactrum salinum]